jgi:hypothetical protein
MKKVLFGLALVLASFQFKAQQVKYYLSMSAQQPWGTNTNINAMNQAFGVGNWIQAYYSSVNVNALFQPSVCLIFMEGGDSHANAMNTFLQTNMTAIQNWVSAGGRLLVNAAPNQGGNINYGFGGMLLDLTQPVPLTLPGRPGILSSMALHFHAEPIIQETGGVTVMLPVRPLSL